MKKLELRQIIKEEIEKIQEEEKEEKSNGVKEQIRILQQKRDDIADDITRTRLEWASHYGKSTESTQGMKIASKVRLEQLKKQRQQIDTQLVNLRKK